MNAVDVRTYDRLDVKQVGQVQRPAAGTAYVAAPDSLAGLKRADGCASPFSCRSGHGQQKRISPPSTLPCRARTAARSGSPKVPTRALTTCPACELREPSTRD